MKIEVKPICEADVALAERLYLDAFPPEERRPWEDVVSRHRLCLMEPSPRFSLLGIYTDHFTGFITIWRFADFDYIEHFAIDPQKRSQGLGGAAISAILSGFCAGRVVVLESEPAHYGLMACRRLDFYRRCGFTVHKGFEYIQPPYAPGLPAVPLLLLTAGEDQNISLSNLTRTLHHEVYGL